MPRVWAPVLLLIGAAPPLPLTFDEVLTRAEAHPTLEARDAALARRRAGDAEISSLSANPQLQVLPGWRLPGASDDPGFEIQAQLSQTFDLGGIGPARQRAARAERLALGADRRAKALGLRLDAARAWLGLWARRAEQARIEEERDLAAQLAARLARAAELGAALETDAAEATLFAQTLERAALDAEGRSYEQALSLAGALGLDGGQTPTPEGAPPDVALPAEDRWEVWVARAEDLPAAATARVVADARRAQRTEADAQASTRITPTLYAQLERPHDVLLFAGVGVQLPMFANNQRARARAAAAEASAERDVAQAAREARRALRLALHEVAHAREIEAQVRDRILPTAERWVGQANKRFEAGEADVFSVLRARRRLAEVRVTQIGAEEARRWAELKAWLLLASLPSPKASS